MSEEVKRISDQESMVRDLLPPTVRGIIQLVGLQQTLMIVERLGGTTWTTTLGKTEQGRKNQEELAQLIGEEAAKKVARHWVARGLYIPRCTTALRRLRDMEINAHYEEATRSQSANAVVNELARRYKLSDRRVWDILKQPTVNPDNQAGLF